MADITSAIGQYVTCANARFTALTAAGICLRCRRLGRSLKIRSVPDVSRSFRRRKAANGSMLSRCVKQRGGTRAMFSLYLAMFTQKTNADIHHTCISLALLSRIIHSGQFYPISVPVAVFPARFPCIYLPVLGALLVFSFFVYCSSIGHS